MTIVQPTTVSEIMRMPRLIQSNKTFFDALSDMICNNTNTLLVVDDKGVLVGKLETFDLIKVVVPDYLEDDLVAAHFADENLFRDDVSVSKNILVRDFMETSPKTLSPDSPLMEAATLALQSNQARLPVIDEDGRPVGILTRTEIKKVIGMYAGVDKCFDKF